MDNFENIKRPKVVDEILTVFKQKLILGELKSGDKTALREAMKMLSALGVIDVRQGDGTYIHSDPTSASLNPLVFAILLQAGMNDDLLELRTLLEVGYCQIAAEKATAEDIASIEKAANHFEDLILSADKEIDLLTQADLEFHYSIMNATGNPLVILISRTVEELFFTSIRNTISKIEGRNWGIDGHRNIIKAIKSKDALQIREAVILSLERWSEDMEDINKRDKKA